jgi:hypothetical protein
MIYCRLQSTGVSSLQFIQINAGSSGLKPSFKGLFLSCGIQHSIPVHYKLATRITMALVGQLGTFNPEEEEWDRYAERVENYLVANGIDGDDRRAAILLTCVGTKNYKILSDLSSPALPSTLTFKCINELLRNHFTPPKSAIVARFHFYKQNRKPAESITEFVAELRYLAKDCAFGNNLETMLRDRLVCGVDNAGIQRKLLAEPGDLTFARAQQLAITMESASKHVEHMMSAKSASNKS